MWSGLTSFFCYKANKRGVILVIFECELKTLILGHRVNPNMLQNFVQLGPIFKGINLPISKVHRYEIHCSLINMYCIFMLRKRKMKKNLVKTHAHKNHWNLNILQSNTSTLANSRDTTFYIVVSFL